MPTGKTLFAQLMDFLPWTTFARIVERYDGDRYVKSLRCAEHFRIMAFAQLTYRESLRDIEACLSAQASKLYHLGFREAVHRTTLSDANEARDWRIYADFAQVLIRQARKLYASETLAVELSETVYALDSTTIDLCLSVFPWARFRSAKAAVKLHTLLDLRGAIPSFIHVSDGKWHDLHMLDLLLPQAGAIYIMDRGYLDFARLHALQRAGAFFVTRSKTNLDARRIYSAPVDRPGSFVIRPSLSTATIVASTIPANCAGFVSRFPKPARLWCCLPINSIFPPPPPARSIRIAGRWKSSSSGSSSIYASNASSVLRRMP